MPSRDGRRRLRRTPSATDNEVARSPQAPLKEAAARLCSQLAVDRVSLASTTREHFTIVAHAGRGILAAGTRLPLATSTQIGSAARGVPYVSRDFVGDPAWAEPTDRLMLALGFRSGCSLPLHDDEGRLVGVVSSSWLAADGPSGRRVDALASVAPLLGRLLASPSARPLRPPAVIVCLDDELLAQGVARLAERAGGLVVGTPRSLPLARAQVASGVALAIVGPSFDGHPADEALQLLRDAGSVGALLLAPRDAGSESLLAAIRAALTDPRDGRRDEDRGPLLTPREQQLLVHLERGVPFKQAAAALGIAESTSRWYARGLFRKLGATSRGDAVHRPRRLGLL